MSAYPSVPNNISRVERSQWTDEMNPFRVRDAARRHLGAHQQHRTPVAPQFQAAPSQPSNSYEPFCFQPYPPTSYTPVTRPMYPAPLIPKGYAELPTSETSMPGQAHGTFQAPYPQSQRNIPRSLMPGYEPLPQSETYERQVCDTPSVTQPLRRSARNKPSVHQSNQNEDPQTQSRKPNGQPTPAERMQELRAPPQALASRREGSGAKVAEQRRQALEVETANYGKNLGRAWQASRNKGETTHPSVTISNIHRANERILVWLDKVEGEILVEGEIFELGGDVVDGSR